MITLLYFIPTIFHLVLDSIRIISKKKFVNHLRSGFLTAGVGIICTAILFFIGEREIWIIRVPMAMLCYHFALFSLSLNIVRMIFGSLPKNFWNITYLNSPSDGEQNWWDKVLEPIPPHGRLLMWGIIFLAGVGFQSYMQCIINGTNCP